MIYKFSIRPGTHYKRVIVVGARIPADLRFSGSFVELMKQICATYTSQEKFWGSSFHRDTYSPGDGFFGYNANLRLDNEPTPEEMNSIRKLLADWYEERFPGEWEEVQYGISDYDGKVVCYSAVGEIFLI